MTTAELITAAAILVDTSADYTADEFAEHLEAFVAAAEDKIKALRIVCRAAEGRAAACKAESALYAAAAKTYAGNADRVKARAFMLMEAAEIAGETLLGARLQPNGGKQPLVYAADFDASALPFDCQRVTVEADADKVRNALAAGAALAGVTLGEVGRHLRWREK